MIRIQLSEKDRYHDLNYPYGRADACTDKRELEANWPGPGCSLSSGPDTLTLSGQPPHSPNNNVPNDLNNSNQRQEDYRRWVTFSRKHQEK